MIPDHRSALVIIQEMSSRMGAVTGKGLSDLIREEFGLRADVLLMARALSSTELLQHRQPSSPASPAASSCSACSELHRRSRSPR